MPALAREGYVQNAIVYRAVKLVAENVGGCAFLVEEGVETRDRHPLLDLIARPNPREDGAKLLETIATHLLIAGNAYVEAVSIDGAPRELHTLRPDRMRLVPGSRRLAGGLRIHGRGAHGALRPGGGAAADPASLALASARRPLRARAARSRGGRGRHAQRGGALEQGAARQCGAAVRRAGLSGADGAVLSDDQFERLKRELEDNYQGARNAGRPLVLEGGLDWKAMSLSPKDMDFMDAKHAAAREIALAFGVPPQLLGIPGDNTYSNYQEANRVFFRATVLPFANRIGGALARGFAPRSARCGSIADADQIDALASTAPRSGAASPMRRSSR